MNENLQNLANKLGISTSFSDAGLKRKSYEVDVKTVKFFAKALGYNADSDKQIENSLLELENERWRHPLEPIYVRNINNLVLDGVHIYDDADYLSAWEDGNFSFDGCNSLKANNITINEKPIDL